jgi:uncharacterized membrane protein YebE (DUF533 family)
MSLGNIIGNMLSQGTSSQSQNRLRKGAENAERSGGGIEQMLGSLMGGSGASGTSGGDFAQRARDFLGKEQAGGMSGAKIGGLGAAAGALFGGGLGGAVKGGGMAVLGTLALKAWRDHQAQQGAGAPDAEPSQDEIEALTGPDTERLVLRAMIGAAQADGRINEVEMEKILGRMQEDEVTEEERRTARAEVQRPVDVEVLGAQVSRPEVATEVYLAALMAVDIDTEAERDYFRRLAKAMRLDPEVVTRLHRMTGAPSVASSSG